MPSNERAVGYTYAETYALYNEQLHYARALHASFVHDDASTQPCRSLIDLCVLAVCRDLPALPLDKLPVELVQQIVAELHSRRLLTQDALPFFRHVQLQSLVLSGCAGVQDE